MRIRSICGVILLVELAYEFTKSGSITARSSRRQQP